MTIRLAQAQDCKRIFELLEELATHTGDLDEIDTTSEQLLEDFKNERFFALLAEVDSEVAGCSLFGKLYSTYKGLGLYMTDIVVSHSHRGKGLGEQLFEASVEYATTGGYNFLKWQYLPENELAVSFYKKFGSSIDNKRWTCAIDRKNFGKYKT